jgi:hypothetical protein
MRALTLGDEQAMEAESHCVFGYLFGVFAFGIDGFAGKLVEHADDGVGNQERVTIGNTSSGHALFDVAHGVGGSNLLTELQGGGKGGFGGGKLEQGREMAVSGKPLHGGVDALLYALYRIVNVANAALLGSSKGKLRVFENLYKELFLRFEVPVENPFAHSQLIDDFRHGGGVVPVGSEASGGKVHELGSSLFASCGKSSLFHVVNTVKQTLTKSPISFEFCG